MEDKEVMGSGQSWDNKGERKKGHGGAEMQQLQTTENSTGSQTFLQVTGCCPRTPLRQDTSDLSIFSFLIVTVNSKGP